MLTDSLFLCRVSVPPAAANAASNTSNFTAAACGPWRGLGRTVAASAAFQPEASPGVLTSLASGVRMLSAFWLPNRPQGRSPANALQRGGVAATAAGRLAACGGGGGRAAPSAGVAGVATTVHRAKSAWGTQGTGR